MPHLFFSSENYTLFFSLLCILYLHISFKSSTWWCSTAHTVFINVLNFKTNKPWTKWHIFIGILMQYRPAIKINTSHNFICVSQRRMLVCENVPNLNTRFNTLGYIVFILGQYKVFWTLKILCQFQLMNIILKFQWNFQNIFLS